MEYVRVPVVGNYSGGGYVKIKTEGAKYKQHHVVRVKCSCTEGDCPYTGEDFIVDTLAKTVGTGDIPTTKEFRQYYPYGGKDVKYD
ncbi:hypothetical protein SDC9_202399 [bioreactor metagenome]|uniref:Uncharacterized protein n=1 Tax=bioreactor metagenome TaxID=1076179 RepID=A0A645IV40_9ZZZZ